MNTLTLNKMRQGFKRFSTLVPINIGLVLCFIFALFVSPSSGQTLEDYLLTAAENNPELQAEFARYQASLEQVNQAGTLPDPEISMGVFIQKMETLMGDQKADFSIMQMFPWFGMLKVQEEEAALMAKAQYESFREAKNNLFLQVKETYYQLYLVDQKRLIAEENKKILETLEQVALTRFGSGTSSESIMAPSSTPKPSMPEMGANEGMTMGGGMPTSGTSSAPSSGGMPAMGGGASGKMTDVLRVQIQIKEIDNELAQLEEERRILQVKFNLLLNRETEMEVAVAEELEEPQMQLSEAVLDSALNHNPMVKMLALDGEAAAKQAEMARLEGRPMFGVGLNYMYYNERAPMGSMGGAHGGAVDYMPGGMGGNMVMPMVSMTLPLNRKKYKSMVKSSELMREATVQQQKAAENELSAMLEEMLSELRTIERNAELYAAQTKLLRQTLDLMLTDYATGAGSFEELLGVQQQLLDYRLKEISNKVMRQIAWARLYVLMGREG
jgi:outer membrane protein TolC